MAAEKRWTQTDITKLRGRLEHGEPTSPRTKHPRWVDRGRCGWKVDISDPRATPPDWASESRTIGDANSGTRVGV
jgi:hypothetical protein